jgi:hypothetical protein
MRTFIRSASSVIAAFGAVAVASALSAGAAPIVGHGVTSPSSALVKVHHDSRIDRHHRRHAHKHYRRGEVVNAPFTRVETGRRVIVDAPFAHVYSGRRGHHVEAPFVDLWVPR